MNIKLFTFAQLKEQLGNSPWQAEMSDTTTLKDLQAHLCQTYPEAQAVILASRFAVNQTYTHDLEHIIVSTDELALIPPVSGG